MMAAIRHPLSFALAAATVVAVCALSVAAGSATAAAAPCHGTNLSGKVRQSTGAAGTIALSIALRNTSNSTCSLRGYPLLKLRNAAGPLPTRVRHGGLALLERAVATVTLAPGRAASLLLAYGDVPVGAETSCPAADDLVVILRHGQGRVHVSADIGACNGGLLRISPFLPGLVGV